jgi:hypothetical protein
MHIMRARRLLAGVTAAFALSAAAAGAAAAAPAHWVTTGPATFTGSNITLTRNGIQPKTCPTFSLPGSIGNGGTQGVFTMPYGAMGWTNTCDGKPFKVQLEALANVAGGAYTLSFTDNAGFIWGDTLWTSTSGSHRFIPFTVPFTNPAGGAQATLTFSNTPIATSNGGLIIRMTGTLTATGAGTSPQLAP